MRDVPRLARTLRRREDGGEVDRRTALVQEDAGRLLAAADADGDGRYDLAVREDEAVFVWLRGDDGFSRVQVAEAPLSAVEFPDVDGDGHPDIVGLLAGELFVRRARR
jgi:hypothetical protein